MKTIQERPCGRCRRGMRFVAEISPMHGGYGLLAYLCTDCGASETALIPPDDPPVETSWALSAMDR